MSKLMDTYVRKDGLVATVSARNAYRVLYEYNFTELNVKQKKKGCRKPADFDRDFTKKIH